MAKVTEIKAIPARFSRPEAYLGSHDVPEGGGAYFRRPHLRAVYSKYFETTFVKITLDDGTIGWGECLAPVAPRVATAIIEDLLTIELFGAEIDDIPALRAKMYGMMRDRGYFGGFYVDAITAVDIALWDAKGKILGKSVTELLGGDPAAPVPAYVSAIGGVEDAEKADLVTNWIDKGFLHFKHHGGRGIEPDSATMNAIVEAASADSIVGFDGHWVYGLDEAKRLGTGLAELGVTFFEAPMDPEEVGLHAELTKAIDIPVAVGECLRTRYEFRPWLQQKAAGLLQPDVGRAGISETVAIASEAAGYLVPVAPHLSVGLGPMIAASIHVAASIPNLYLLEYQPPTVALANELLHVGIQAEKGHFLIPNGVGLGIDVSEKRIDELQV